MSFFPVYRLVIFFYYGRLQVHVKWNDNCAIKMASKCLTCCFPNVLTNRENNQPSLIIITLGKCKKPLSTSVTLDTVLRLRACRTRQLATSHAELCRYISWRRQRSAPENIVSQQIILTRLNYSTVSDFNYFSQ